MKKIFLSLSFAAALYSSALHAQTDDASYRQKIRQLYEEVKKNPVLRNFDVEKNWSLAVSRHSDPNVQKEIFDAAKNRYISERLAQQSNVQSHGNQAFSYSYN